MATQWSCSICSRRGMVKSIIAKRFSLDDANTALLELRNGKVIGRAIISQ